MCWFELVNCRKKSSTPLTILHPEEPRNDSQTVANTNTGDIVTKWLTDWKVPPVHWEHWRNAIVIRLYDVWPPEMLATGLQPETPAATWEADGKRHLASLAKWFNPGVIAHEQAHNSYALLSAWEKLVFSAVYKCLNAKHPLINYLYSVNSYGRTSDIEGHAEVYRYLGETMPPMLQRYYPRLI